MRRFLRVLTVTTVALLAIGTGAVPAMAVSPSGADLTANPQYMKIGVDVPVFGIDLISSGLSTNLSEVRVDFAQVTGGGTFGVDDLEANPDGIELWRDSSMVGANQDKLDGADAVVPTTFSFDSNLRATLAVSPAYPLPAAEEGAYTFFLSIRLGDSVTNGDNFMMTLPADAFDTGLLDPSITAVPSHQVIADTVAPTALFTAPANQSANLSWKISEPVVGVGQSSVALRLHGTLTEVPVTVSYDSATNTIVANTVSDLTAGQEYDAVLLPNGPGSITDRAGNELDDKTDQFRAATNVNEIAPGVRYGWRSLSNSSTYGGSYYVNNMPGASIAYRFSGSSIAWYTITDPYQGKASVSIDGRSFGTVNNYSSSTRYKVGRSFSGLSAGAHTITIRVTGSKGSSAAKDVRVAIDAFRSGGSTNVTPSLSFRWAAISASGADGGTYRAARFSGTEMSFVFSGTSIAWRTVRGPAMGQAYVYIDGVRKGLFDNYSSTTTYKVLRAILNLPAGTHTITIKVASTRNSRSTDRIIAVDGFVIG